MRLTSLSRLLERYERDAGHAGADRALATAGRLCDALNDIGWRAASDVPADEVATELALIVAACVAGHRDLARLRRDVADCLRQYAHHLDGSASAREDWEPAATKVIDLYVAE